MKDVRSKHESMQARLREERDRIARADREIERRARRRDRVLFGAVALFVLAFFATLAAGDARAAKTSGLRWNDRVTVEVAGIDSIKDQSIREELGADGCAAMSSGCDCDGWVMEEYPVPEFSVTWSAPHDGGTDLGGGRTKYVMTGSGGGTITWNVTPPLSVNFTLEPCDFIVEGPEYVRIYRCYQNEE